VYGEGGMICRQSEYAGFAGDSGTTGKRADRYEYYDIGYNYRIIA
jgi:dTDP-4-amino-4,6-dideoxygalactose transaminase